MKYTGMLILSKHSMKSGPGPVKKYIEETIDRCTQGDPQHWEITEDDDEFIVVGFDSHSHFGLSLMVNREFPEVHLQHIDFYRGFKTAISTNIPVEESPTPEPWQYELRIRTLEKALKKAGIV